MKYFALLAVIGAFVSVTSSFVVTARWQDAQSIELCSTRAGELRVAGSNLYIGEIDAGCRTFPPPGTLIDAAYAPMAGRSYCVVAGNERVCSAPLARPLAFRTYLPIVTK